jgi:hypothetical protein
MHAGEEQAIEIVVVHKSRASYRSPRIDPRETRLGVPFPVRLARQASIVRASACLLRAEKGRKCPCPEGEKHSMQEANLCGLERVTQPRFSRVPLAIGYLSPWPGFLYGLLTSILAEPNQILRQSLPAG